MSNPSVTREECERAAKSEAELRSFNSYKQERYTPGFIERLARAHLALLDIVDAAWKQAKETGEEIGIHARLETSLDTMICAIGDKYSELLDSSEQTIQAAEKLAECLEKLKLFRTSQYHVMWSEVDAALAQYVAARSGK